MKSNLHVINGHQFRKQDVQLWKKNAYAGFISILEQGIRGHPTSRPLWTPSPIYSIGLILQGEVTYKAPDGTLHSIGSGWIFQEQPGIPSSFVIAPQSLYRDWLIICNAEVWKFLHELDALPSGGPLWKTPSPAFVASSFRETFNQIGSKGVISLADGVLLLYQFLRRLTHHLAEGASPIPTTSLRKAADLLDQNPGSSTRVEFLLRSLPHPYDLLRKAFKKSFGISPAQYQIRSRINAACRLLQRYSVGETASRLGYPDSFAFSKQFKKITGSSPRSFRKLLPRSDGEHPIHLQ